MEKSSCKVCVTGAAGYIGSSLVKKLLEKGYTVHATLRNLDDPKKVSLLKSLPDADTRLVLFKADIYNPNEFEHAINGCEFVFHVATPILHIESSQFKNTTEAAIAAANSIALSCIRSGTVKRFIYTGSGITASPLKDDGSGFKDTMDESCWTPLHITIACSDESVNNVLKDYVVSKTLAENEILSYGNNAHFNGLEVVTLLPGLVGGDTILSYTPGSVGIIISPITYDEPHYQTLRFTEELLGKVPIIHIEDVIEAHIFCMEKPSMNGRFFCVSGYISSAEIVNYYQQNYPEFHVKQEYLDVPKRQIKFGSTRLIEKGFEYKCDTKKILDDCVKCARRMGDLQP